MANKITFNLAKRVEPDGCGIEIVCIAGAYFKTRGFVIQIKLTLLSQNCTAGSDRKGQWGRTLKTEEKLFPSFGSEKHYMVREQFSMSHLQAN